MRRIALIAVAVGMLVAAGAAYAASQINDYTATLKFSPTKAGTASKPVPISYTQDYKADGTNGNRTAVLLDIKTKIYGVKADGKDFPTCSASAIAKAGNDTVCPKGARFATGDIVAALGPKNNFQTPGTPCTPQLDVWNSGQGKLTFFFVDTATHPCIGLKTGTVPPYPGTYKMQGKYLVIDVPVPSYVSFPAGLAGSLQKEHLVWAKMSKKVKGKTVAATAAVGCQGKKRPYSVTFKATLPTTGQTQTSTVNATGPCK